MKCRGIVLLSFFIGFRAVSQTQTCPANINFASGYLTHWYAYTGNNRNGNGESAILQNYDSIYAFPSGTKSRRDIPEYNLPSVTGIYVNTFNSEDPFGGFPLVPTINGYSYKYSIKLGSTAIAHGGGPDNTSGGGYIRGVSYSIKVPAGPASEPYTMTYAYAMVLENGTHKSVEQPKISATLKTPAGIIDCASPSYLLPTFDNVSFQGRGATLDSATARKNGFRVSAIRTPNRNPDPNADSEYLQDVWVKGWTEVTFDLSLYRGSTVTLTFEADNCVPGGHFSYGYIALRNDCAGLMISGDSLVCNNTIITYSVPSLADAVYNWTLPADWTLLSADTSNILRVKSSSNGGTVHVREKNSCADLSNDLKIKTLPSPEAGTLDGSTTVCAGENISQLNLLNYSGTILQWLGSTDSINYSVIQDVDAYYSANNLEKTTFYKVVVGKGDICPSDTTGAAIISVDKKTIGGNINPLRAVLCSGQTAGELLTLTGNRGSVQNWQSSQDDINWTYFGPQLTRNTYTVKGITSTTYYRLINKNGVCPTDTSSVTEITFNPVSYPEALVFPEDTVICFGTPATLGATIGIGTSYTWSPTATGIGNIGNTPFDFIRQVYPKTTGDYILRILNEGCPNPLFDTAHIVVLAPVVVDAGRDTSVVAGQPLQFNASSDDAGPDSFLWEPSTKLSNVFIPDPVGIYSPDDNIIKYSVKATTPFGCTGEGFITIKIFKIKPDIFVPNAFTPGTASNGLFRPIPVGVSSIEYFRIYNRVGQLVYSTAIIGRGWDGLLNGIPQSSGGYVWMVKGTDYTGGIITKRGTMVLIR